MREIVRETQFRRDVKPAAKRSKDTMQLQELLLLLIEGNPLPGRFRDHALSGNWKHFRECHIAPDWLLIYKVDQEALYLVRTGTHSDLF